MIISFYDREFKPLLNNASLLIDKNSYHLVKRPIELNDFSCVCEPFTEDIQPTFIVVKDDKGDNKNLVYSALAGVPILNKDNKTEINATDLKTLFSSDIITTFISFTTVGEVINHIFDNWNTQVNQGSINCELVYEDYADLIKLDTLQSTSSYGIYNALEEMQAFLNAYNLYLDSSIDLKNKKVIFTIGKTMTNPQNIKLWEYGIKNYGKWVADVNETQGYLGYEGSSSWSAGIKWILTSDNAITINESERDIYPIKRRVVRSTSDLAEANKQALIELLNARYNENLELTMNDESVGFKTCFNVYVKDNFITKPNVYYYGKNDLDFTMPIGLLPEANEVIAMKRFYGIILLNNIEYIVKESDIENVPYKKLPCGELRYNSSGLYEIQIGFRYVGVDFI